MTTPALSLSRFPSSSISASPVDRCHRSTAVFRRYGPSFAYKPAAGICYASPAVELLPSLYPEIVVRDAKLEDCWENKFLLDLVLRIDRYIALLSGFSVPPGCMWTCLVAVNSNSLTNGFNIECGDPREAEFQKYNLSRGSIAGILTVDTVADYLPRRGHLKQRASEKMQATYLQLPKEKAMHNLFRVISTVNLRFIADYPKKSLIMVN